MKKPVPETARPPILEESDRLIAEGDRAEAEGKLPAACESYRRAVEVAPAYARAWLNLGVALEASGDSEAALNAYKKAHAIEPANPYASYNLGKLLYMQGMLNAAEEALQAALANKADFPQAFVVLSGLYEAQGKPSAAVAALEIALKQQPDWAGALLNYGLLLQRLGRTADAEAVLSRTTTLDPDNASAWFFLGNVLAEEEKEGAIRCYQKALDLNPDFADGHHNLGNALSKRGQWEEAFACYKKAVELQPDFSDAHVGLGNAFKQRDELDSAIESFRKAVRLKPDSLEAHFNLGAALRDQDHFFEALQHLERALVLAPESADVRWLHAMCQIPAVYEAGQNPDRLRIAFARHLENLDSWFDSTHLAKGLSAVGNQQPFYLAYQEDNNRDLLRLHGKLCVRIMNDWFQRQRLISSPSRAAGRAIRVGFVSKHFYNHSVWQAIVKGWFRQLNRERFTIYAFHLGVENDSETRTAMAQAAHFDRGPLDLKAWVETILRHNLDVLIYPEVGMDTLTLKLACLRLAPVQVATWGHPDTTGLETMDYYLSAEDLEPPDAEEAYTERLVRLPHLGCWFERTPVTPVAPDLAAIGVDQNCPLLLCPGTPYKYAPQRDWVLTELARKLGRCRFIFFRHSVSNMSEKLRNRLKVAFDKVQLRFDDYVTFVPWQSRPAFYGWLQRADVFLDTIGFSGFNTAMQAIECGAPIVTKEGRFMRGRLASGILRRMGLTELIARSAEDYIDLAARLAADPAYRGQVRELIENSREVLFEDVAPIRGFETFLSDVAAARRV